MTFSNTLSSILSSSLMKSTFLFSLQSFYFPACLKLIGGKKKNCFAWHSDHVHLLPIFFFLLRVDYFGEEIEFLILSNISRIPSVKSLLPSFLLFTDLCILCSVQNKHVTNHMVCNFLSFFSLSTPWLLPKYVFSVAISPHIYFLQKAFFPWRVNPAVLFHSLWKSKNIWSVGFQVWFLSFLVLMEISNRWRERAGSFSFIGQQKVLSLACSTDCVV